MRHAIFLSIALMFSSVVACLAQERDLVGRYTVEGANPGGGGVYRGEVEVVASGETFAVRWKISGKEYRGTGILRDGTLSIIYQQTGAGPGIAVFSVKGNGSLSGAWTGFGMKSVGSEVWNPRDRT